MKTSAPLALAACAVQFAATGQRIQLLPAGVFRSVDGRPEKLPGWYLDAGAAQRLVAALAARTTPLVIDYEHQTLHKEQNGQPAPAAGWFHALEWVEGEGLFAVDVQWTERAAAMIAAGEYRFISPVFAYDERTGEVSRLVNAALTNTPALDGLQDVLLAASARLLPQPSEEDLMEQLLEQLRWMLNLPVSATAEEISAELQKLIDRIKPAEAQAAASFHLATLIDGHEAKIAALTAQTGTEPDPARYVPIAVLNAANAQLAALSEQLAVAKSRDLDELVIAALNQGRLLPAQEAWARQLGSKDMEALKNFLNATVPIAALTRQQSETQPITGTATLSDEELAVCSQLGLTAEQFLNAKETK